MTSSSSHIMTPQLGTVTRSDIRSLLSVLALDLGRTRVPLLVLLLSADIIFIALHLSYTLLGRPDHINFALSTEHGYSEVLQYLKAFWIGLALLWLGLGLRQRSEQHVFVIWALLFFYLALDDAAAVHERAGQWMAQAWNLPAIAQLRPADLGEVIFAAGIATIGLVLIAMFHFQSTPESRRASRQLFMLLSLFALFAVGIDMLASSFNHRALEIIEDGGELLVMSLILVFALNIPQSSTGLPSRMFRQ